MFCSENSIISLLNASTSTRPGTQRSQNLIVTGWERRLPGYFSQTDVENELPGISGLQRQHLDLELFQANFKPWPLSTSLLCPFPSVLSCSFPFVLASLPVSRTAMTADKRRMNEQHRWHFFIQVIKIWLTFLLLLPSFSLPSPPSQQFYLDIFPTIIVCFTTLSQKNTWI